MTRIRLNTLKVMLGTALRGIVQAAYYEKR